MIVYTAVVDVLGWQIKRGTPADVVDRLQYVRSNRKTWQAGSGANAIVVYVVNMTNYVIHVNTYGAIGNEAIRIAKQHGWQAVDVVRVGSLPAKRRSDNAKKETDYDGREQQSLFSESAKKDWSFLE